MGIFHMRFPVGYYWSDPNFFSISVPYGRTSDFFFSGHCGFLSICFFEWRVNFTLLFPIFISEFINLRIIFDYSSTSVILNNMSLNF